MAECFCGCGRKVGITSRGMNKQGRRTVGLLAKLREAHDKLERGEGAANPVFLFEFAVSEGADERDPDSISRKMGEQLDELIEEGEEYELFWIDAVHGGALPPPSEARQIKRAWEEWGKGGMIVASAWGVPPEKGVGAVLRGRVSSDRRATISWRAVGPGRPMLRRKRLENWSPQILAKHVRVAYSDSGVTGDWTWVKAIIVLHQNPDRLPRRDVRKGIEDGTFFPYVVLEFIANDHNIAAGELGTVEDMLTDVQGFETLAGAQADAEARMPGATEMSFAELPNIMKAAFTASTTGWQPRREF